MSVNIVERFIFDGTPALLQALLIQYSELNQDDRAALKFSAKTIQSDDPRLVARLTANIPDHGFENIVLDATLAGANQSRVFITATPDRWTLLQPAWARLRGHIEAHMEQPEQPTQKNAGAIGYACNLWLNRMIEKGWPPGEPKDDNPIFVQWLELYVMEVGKEPGDIGATYRKAIAQRRK